MAAFGWPFSFPAVGPGACDISMDSWELRVPKFTCHAAVVNATRETAAARPLRRPQPLRTGFSRRPALPGHAEGNRMALAIVESPCAVERLTPNRGEISMFGVAARFVTASQRRSQR